MELKLLYTFNGKVSDNFGTIYLYNFTKDTEAKSYKQAISNLNFAAKKQLKLLANTKILLNGQLACNLDKKIIKYKVVNNQVSENQLDEIIYKYAYKLASGMFKLNKYATLPYYVHLLNFFEKDSFSYDQFMYKFLELQDKEILYQKNNSKDILRYNQLIPESEISFSDEYNNSWIFDEESRTFLKNGWKKSDYLVAL